MEGKSINISDDYVTLFINNSNPSKEAQTYAVSQKNPVHIINVLTDPLTAMQILELAQKCNIPLDELFDHSHEFFTDKVKDTANFSEADLAQMLADNPELFRIPFVVKGNQFKFYDTHMDLGNLTFK